MKQAPEADAAGLFSGGEYMAYTALYRKWRPDTFEAVKGQEHIVTTLKNQMKSGRIGHAYLFCGTRGTGKTTVAKIFCQGSELRTSCGWESLQRMSCLQGNSFRIFDERGRD